MRVRNEVFMERENFGTRLGFILVSAGCAIGIGNVWRFPYITGENGGGIFVLFYLLFLVCMGIPILTMELAIGRAGKGSAVAAYKALEKPGQKWHVHGWFCLIGNYLLMMYYTTVSGWMLGYFFKYATGTFYSGMDGTQINGVFSTLLSNPAELAWWMAITVIGGFLVTSFGLVNGVEKITKFMMLALLGLIILLAVHSFFLKGAAEGLSFYLLPNMEHANQTGLGKVITSAMNQAFFTLSLGIGSMEIFGSYMPKDHTLTGEAVRICALDTFVAIMSGIIIFPACFSYGIQPNDGPSLIFETLPNVFANMPGGRIWGTLFFLFMTFASFSTVIAVFENLLAGCMDNFGWSRKKASFLNCLFVLAASMPCVLGFSLWSNLPLPGGRNVLSMEDFLVSNLLLPLGSLLFLLFCVTKYGWGFDHYLKETNTGTGLKMSSAFKWYFRIVLPILILVILIQGLIV